MAATERDELAGVVEDLRGHLEWLRENGVDALPVPPQAAAAAGAAAGAPRAVAPAVAQPAASAGASSLRAAVRAAVGAPDAGRRAASPVASPPVTPAPTPAPPPVASATRTLEQVRAELGECQRCRLCSGRGRLVFGEGNPNAELVFVGEGPAEEDDQSGRPFSGPAGELLTKMIEAMGFARSDVFLTNVVKCRLPGNRAPQPEEIAACEPFLAAQLASIQPKAVVALGKVASQVLLREQTPITELRGNWREYRGLPLMPTFHPAYLLRSPAEKRKVWEDLKLVMKLLGRDGAAKR
jgi:DNA polymerase